MNFNQNQLRNEVYTGWVPYGSSIIYPQGNVGIGTNNPTSTLTVIGNISACGSNIPVRWSTYNQTAFVQNPGSMAYYKIATLPVISNAASATRLRISGTIGGFIYNNSTGIDAYIISRGGLAYGGKLTGYGGDGTASCDIVIYLEPDNTYSVYLACISFYYFDLLLWGEIGGLWNTTIYQCPVTNTSISAPTGTLQSPSLTNACRTLVSTAPAGNVVGNVGIGTTNPTSPLDVNDITQGLVTRVNFEGTVSDQLGSVSFTQGNGALPYVPGKVGQAGNFSGNTVSATPAQWYYSAPPVSQPPFTLAFWFNPQSTSWYGTIMSLNNGTGFTYFNLDYGTGFNANNSIGFFLDLNTQWAIVGTTMNSGALTIGTWYHMCITVTSAWVTTLYVNGSQVATQTGTGNFPTAPTRFTLGGNGDGTAGGVPTRGANFYIDDLRWYNRALNVNEISKIYQTTSITSAKNIVTTGSVGIGTTNPQYPLDVTGIGRFTTVTTGGWLFAGIGSTVTFGFSPTNTDMNWTLIANSRISFNAGNVSFNIPDAGAYIAHVQLNSDSTNTGNIAVYLYQDTTGAGAWSNIQNSEMLPGVAWNGAMETRCTFFIYQTTAYNYKFQLYNGTGANFSFATTAMWSRMSIYKVG